MKVAVVINFQNHHEFNDVIIARSKTFVSSKNCKNGALERVPHGITNYVYILALIPCIEIGKRNMAL